MKLVDFIKDHKEEISQEWIKHASVNIESAKKMKLDEIKDHITEMLDIIANDMITIQTNFEQEKKSHGNKSMSEEQLKAAIAHGEQRLAYGFDIGQLSSEFRALRASVLRLWEEKSREENWKSDFQEMIRFNEAIDEFWMISVQRFQKKLDESKNWFLRILGHDLRNPLTTISAANSLLKLSKNITNKDKTTLRRSDTSVKRMTELINNLLELTELRLGVGLSIKREKVDLTKICTNVSKAIQLAYPQANIILDTQGQVNGSWDALRMDQMMTNLITNAIHHGKDGGNIKVKLYNKENSAYFIIHNEGPVIPETLKDKIFENNFSKSNSSQNNERNFGLGLFIVNEIVKGHRGKIYLKSLEGEGTTFKITLPNN